MEQMDGGGQHRDVYKRQVLLQDAHDDDHEGSGGAAYLIFASAEQGDEEPGHNGGDEALGWGESACRCV